MGFLFQEYINQRPEEWIIDKFKLGVTNSFEIEYEMFKDELEVASNDKDRGEFYRLKSALEINTKYVTNLFSEIGYNSSVVELRKEFLEPFDIFDYHYNFEDIWSFLINLPQDEFYATMVYISQTSTTNKLINKLQKITKSELLRNRIEVPEYRKTVFIAMSFAEEMKKFRESIMRIIEDRGYRA